MREILLATPRGFCAGVERAIEIVEKALALFGPPIHVRHEVVHNRFVVERLRHKGAIFIDELEEAPKGATVIFSAHGVSQAVREQATQLGLRVFDATCPLVTKVHMEVVRHHKVGLHILMIGHKGHPEVEGTMGQVPDRIHLIETLADIENLHLPPDTPLAYVTQTTLSVDDAQTVITALKARFPHIEGPKKDDICYATQNRQDAVKALAEQVELVLVVGSSNSSNSNRLREVASLRGTEAWLIDGPHDIDPLWLEGKTRIGLTAGASAPENLVLEVIEHLKTLGPATVRTLAGVPEKVVFALPKALQVAIEGSS
jgi:4-hydroxy-3-methylbut-2-en-1-yl diphosphate reductase